MPEFLKKNLFKLISLVIILLLLAVMHFGQGNEVNAPEETVSPTPLPAAEFQAAPPTTEASE